ncbi:A disintegrin and metalloproteinase with thrombospondin motifs 7 [Astyanax mexicanus]|uniref:A disintegrin and metalloproteinase with thrombospondin motifs 7 n=1 Tax=Astyanax mexicanus TaxID=7994 RepID=A0A8T2L653_ASTMX|nr:A disintegrin and metalloproteinase with thrombospondin motifs 7 [Astyanax mexicanus]
MMLSPDRGLTSGLLSGSALPLLLLWVTAGLVSIVQSDKTNEQLTDSSLEGLLQYEVIHPQRVDSTGHFISNLVSHRVSRIRRRQTEDSGESLPHVFYNLQYGGQELHFNLSLNPHLLAPGFLTERRYGGLQGSTLHSHGHSVCYFLGEVWSSSATKGQAAVSTCDGLTGLFKLSEEEFFIRPLEQPHGTAKPQAHVIYKRDTSQTDHQLVQPLSLEKPSNGTCGVKDPRGGVVRVERQRERWEKRQHRRRQRSISREKWVETLVVADPKMVEYHGRNGVESYVLSVMNIVAGLFHDSSIGNAINIVVVRLILLEQDEEDLKITHHADNSLNSFCKWQKHLNMKGDDHPVHHDVAVLLTRKDICAATNKPCETLGLSHVAGMCQPHRSCSINEDTGLPLAFTVAHELGHNFGIQHDGNGNDCEPVGKRPFVMSPQLLYGNSPPNWSRCSRQYITRFLDTLWCTVDSTCHSKLDGAVDGTKCGEGKWCLSGECVPVGLQPEKVDGGWGPWSEWSPCTRTCGAGIQSAQRDCDSPAPKNGGRYCLGERLRYKVCKRKPCPLDQPSFKSIQCSRFNTVPYKGKFYKWVHVNNRIHPCELHCRPLSEHFSEKMVDAVIDGTQCYEGTQSRDMCINGICKNIGCDYEIDSNAVEDRCGVCQGNGSTCETVKKTFEDSEGLGYVDIGLIPEGARDIHIEEVAEAGNFLALRSNDPEKYFLNGGWTIQWNGEYKAAGTVFTYERTGQLENLTSPGPTMEPVWIQLLFQETNPGVRYEYTISREILPESINGTPAWDFQWKHGAWTECSATCGTGFKRQVVHCIERMSGIVEEHYCDPATRPDDKRVHCRAEPCPALWWTGAWQKCSSTCGEWGLTKRTVVCIRSLGLDEQEALQPSECQHLPRPEPLTRCSAHIPCPADWTTGNWSECSASCAGGVQVREVTCSWNTGVDCDHQAKPASSLSCNVQECPVNVVDLEWSGSGSSSKEVFSETNSIPDDNHLQNFPIGTTRAQPRGSSGGGGDDLNNITKNDFLYSNHIDSDNSVKNNAQVDDFYYDYNFIKFHEDLSYESFDQAGNGASDFSGIHLQQQPKPSPTTVYRQGADPFSATSFTPSSANPLTSQSVTSPPSSVKPQSPNYNQPDGKASEEDGIFEDYFLPIVTTARPRPSFNTRLSKNLMNPAFKTQDHSTVESPLPTDEVPSNGVGTTLNGAAMPNVHTTHEPHTYGSNEEVDNEYYEDVQTDSPIDLPVTPKDQDSRVPEGDNEQLGEDVPGGESYWESLQVEEEPQEEQPNSPPPFGTDLPFDAYEDITTTTTTTTFFKWNMGSSERPSTSPGIQNEDTENSEAFDEFSQESPTPPSPSPSYNPAEKRSSMTSSAGPESLPHAESHGDLQPPLWTSTELQTSIMPDTPDTTIPAVTSWSEQWATAAPSVNWTEIDNNEIIVPPVLWVGNPSSPDPSPTQSQVPSTQTPGSIEPDTCSPLPSTSSAFWSTGNWSDCSTTCGLGAIWRSVQCSTGNDSECDVAKRPAPARRCYIRPCSAWRLGQWTKCSKNCGGGVKLREIQCYALRDQRPLRPFHCQAALPRPLIRLPCNSHPCLDWYSSSWGQCSELCGGGEQQRLVTCPEDERCDEEQKPSNIQPCNIQPCSQWITGSWGQCSVSCGGGVQRRLVKCVNIKAEQEEEEKEEEEEGKEEEEEQAQCDHEPWPENMRQCNLQDCDSTPAGQLCLRDRLTFRFCQTLQWLGRCDQAAVQAQCCKTCEQQHRGNHRATHR